MRKAADFRMLAFAVLCFSLGFGVSRQYSALSINGEPKRVIGIGGIFFKCKNPETTRQWYSKHLGLQVDKYGTNFEWRQAETSGTKGFTQWSPFSERTKYFLPSKKDYMINYRVEDLDYLVKILREENITILDSIETVAYGKFVHILDLDSNKIELWEPNDNEYDKLVVGRTK